MSRDRVFISYSHKDKKWRDDLDTHLKPYLRDGSITSWSDQQIGPGSQWFREIQSALTNSKIAVLLVSPDFLASDFIHEHELTPILKEAEQGGVKILWVPIRDSAYRRTPLNNYQAVLGPNTPLAAMTRAKRDQAWVTICEEVEKAVTPPVGPSSGRAAGVAGQKSTLSAARLGVGIETDRQTLAKLVDLMSKTRSIDFLREHHFREPFRWSSLDGIQEALRRSGPEHEFIDPELEQLRADFQTACSAFMNYAANNTFVVSFEGGKPEGVRHKIPKDWKTDDPERLCRTVNELHTGAENLRSAYDKLVRAARKKLAP